MPNLWQSARALASGAARGALGSIATLQKAQGATAVAPGTPRGSEVKSLLEDPTLSLTQMGYRERRNPMSHEHLRQMVRMTPVVNAILRTRINQLANFAQPQPNRFDLGFKIRMRDSKGSPTKAVEKRIKEVERFMVQCGATDNSRQRDNFARWIKKVGRDTLTLGHDATEIVPDRKGDPAEFFAVDAASIRLAEMVEEDRTRDPDDVVRYVQVFEDQVVAEYTYNEMQYGVRLPATDLALQGYGECELEMLTDVVANLLNIYNYNGNFFTNNSLPRGIVNLKGEMSQDMLEGFRRQWYAMLSGVDNAFVTPIANASDGIEFVGMQSNNRDMEMQAWHEMMVRCATACFSISPEEIGFGMGPMGMTSSLNAPTNTDKVVEGRERGLVPLLNHFAHNLNTHIVHRLEPDFYLDFVGLGGLTRDQQLAMSTQQVRSYRTVNEVRAEEDLAPLPKEQGDIILDAIWFQNQAMQQQQQQAAQAPAQDPQAYAYGDDDGGQGAQAGQPDAGPPQQPQGAQGPAQAPQPEPMARAMPQTPRLTGVPMVRLTTPPQNFWGDG